MTSASRAWAEAADAEPEDDLPPREHNQSRSVLAAVEIAMALILAWAGLQIV